MHARLNCYREFVYSVLYRGVDKRTGNAEEYEMGKKGTGDIGKWMVVWCTSQLKMVHNCVLKDR